MTRPNDYAYPIDGTYLSNQGLTKREEFAKAAMQGMCAGEALPPHMIADYAVKQADALIDALNKEEPKSQKEVIK